MFSFRKLRANWWHGGGWTKVVKYVYEVVFRMPGVGLWKCLCGVAFRRSVYTTWQKSGCTVNVWYEWQIQALCAILRFKPVGIGRPTRIRFLSSAAHIPSSVIGAMSNWIQACCSIVIGRPSRTRFLSSAAHIPNLVIHLGNTFRWILYLIWPMRCQWLSYIIANIEIVIYW